MTAAEVSLAEIGRIAGVGRAAVVTWQRRHPDFPRPVGGTDDSPTFDQAEAERWLRAHGRLLPPPPGPDGAQLAALGIIRCLLDGILARNVGLDAYVRQAVGPSRAVLDYLREWTGGCCRVQATAVALALARTAVAGLHETQARDVTATRRWLEVQTTTVDQALATPGTPHHADRLVMALASLVTDELHAVPAGDNAAAGTESQADALVRQWLRPDHQGEDINELLLSAGWFAAQMLAFAFRFERWRIEAYLDSHSRELIARGR